MKINLKKYLWSALLFVVSIAHAGLEDDFLLHFHALKAPHDYVGVPNDKIKEDIILHVSFLKNFAYDEVAHRALDVLRQELNMVEGDLNDQDKVKFFDWFFIEMYSLIQSVGNQSDFVPFVKISEDLNKILDRIGIKPDNDKYKVLVKAWVTARDSVQSNAVHRYHAFDDAGKVTLSATGKGWRPRSKNENGPAPGFWANGPIAILGQKTDYREASNMGRAWVGEVTKRLEERAFGQPELIKGLENLELDRVLRPGRRKTPEIIWMLGQGGTGKDTHAEVYTDAIHGYKGAHEDHLLKIPVCREEADAWKLLGSNTGYVGSNKLPELVRFAVKHSGGRYEIKEVDGYSNDSKKEIVVENPAWHPGMDALPGYYPPDTAVLFINEFREWSKAAKDVLLKQMLEKGYIEINAPYGGVSKIYFPATIMIASNDLAPPASANPRTYEQLLSWWNDLHGDFNRIRQELRNTNKKLIGVTNDKDAGISDEILNRVPDSSFFLMRPLSDETLSKIVRVHMEDEVLEYFGDMNTFLGPVTLKYSDNLMNTVKAYRYNAENGGRPMKDYVKALVKETLKKAIQNEVIKRVDDAAVMDLDIEKNPDNTLNLKVVISDKDTSKTLQEISLPILASQSLRIKEPISDERIEKILELETALNKQVFGLKHVTKKLQEALLVSEDMRHSADEQKARSFMFLGLSSTGKTEVAKALSRFLYGNEEEFSFIDFNNLQHPSQVTEKIFGLEGHGPSEFMRAYDRANGNLVILLDEIANVNDPNVLTPLYQLLDEKIVRAFNDGRPRSMKNVTIIMTGNAGEEWYKNIPRDIPEKIQRGAMSEIYNKMMQSPMAQRAFLEKKFRQAFLNRVGFNQTFFFPPLNFKAVRELVQLKLAQSLKKLAKNVGSRYWNVVFTNEKEYVDALERIEAEGFYLWEQGRSLDNYLEKHLAERLRLLLIANKVPVGSDVLLSFNKVDLVSEEDHQRELIYNLQVEGRAEPLQLKLETKRVEEDSKDLLEFQMQVGFHEAGHEILREALLGDLTDPEKITIIPGVGQIGNEMVYYGGVAVANQIKNSMGTREYMLSMIAKLFAGGEMQRLVNRGERVSMGQSNDLQRATAIAQKLILEFRLEDDWGALGFQTKDETVAEFISKLSEDQKVKFNTAVQKLLKEGRDLARKVLIANYTAAVELANALIRKGKLNGNEIKENYTKFPVKRYWELAPEERETVDPLFAKIEPELKVPQRGRELEFAPSVPRPKAEEVADVEKIFEDQKRAEVQQVAVWAASHDLIAKAKTCGSPLIIGADNLGGSGGLKMPPASPRQASAQASGAASAM